MAKPRGKKTTATKRQQSSDQAPMSLTLARSMLPLVSHIVGDIQRRWNHLSKLEREQLDLDRRRRDLTWPERNRRYQVAEEIASEQRSLQEDGAELEQLQVMLVDPVEGEVAFPTIINDRRGYFVWKLGSTDLTSWCYAYDSVRRPIPKTWQDETAS